MSTSWLLMTGGNMARFLFGCYLTVLTVVVLAEYVRHGAL